MAGSRNQIEQHDFYCIKCGKQGIPVWRKKSKRREPFHRKILYCANCRIAINHVEIVTEDEAEQFKKDFADGKYKTEAAEQLVYASQLNKF